MLWSDIKRLESKLPLFSGFTLVPFFSVVLSSFLRRLLQVLLGVEVPFVTRLAQLTVGVQITDSMPNKTNKRCCKNDERAAGTNLTNWRRWRWNQKIKVILILTEILPSVHETRYLKTMITLKGFTHNVSRGNVYSEQVLESRNSYFPSGRVDY